MISTHSMIENMEYYGDINNLLNKRVGILNSKHIQIHVLSDPLDPNSEESV